MKYSVFKIMIVSLLISANAFNMDRSKLENLREIYNSELEKQTTLAKKLQDLGSASSAKSIDQRIAELRELIADIDKKLTANS